MRKAFLMVLALAVPFSAGAQADEESAQWVILDIGLVRVAPTRPGGNQPWTRAAEGPKRNPCGAVGLVAEALTGPWGVGAKLLCDVAEAKGEGGFLRHSPTAPDIFVRLRAGPNASFQSHTVRNTLSHNFNFSVVVPLDAVPRPGVEITVLADDGKDDEDTQETIGSLHLKRQQLEQAARSGELVKLSEGSVETLELTTRFAESVVPAKTTHMLRASPELALVQGVTVLAGQVVEVHAAGHYVTQSSPAYARRIFPKEPVGAALAFVGQKSLVQPVVVGDCAALVSKYGGRIAVGINDKKPDANFGSMDFAITVRNPTHGEWQAGNRSLPCPPPARKNAEGAQRWATDALARIDVYFAGTGGASVAGAIQSIAHPSGKSPALGKVIARVDDDRVVVQIPVSWTGGLVGGRYETVVVWDFCDKRHYAAVIKADSAPTVVAKKNAQDLDAFFRTNVFPGVWSR